MRYITLATKIAKDTVLGTGLDATEKHRVLSTFSNRQRGLPPAYVSVKMLYEMPDDPNHQSFESMWSTINVSPLHHSWRLVPECLPSPILRERYHHHVKKGYIVCTSKFVCGTTTTVLQM